MNLLLNQVNKYLIVLLIFVGAIVFGKNLDDGQIISNQTTFFRNTFLADSEYYNFPGIYSLTSGNKYRVIIPAQIRKIEDITPDNQRFVLLLSNNGRSEIEYEASEISTTVGLHHLVYEVKSEVDSNKIKIVRENLISGIDIELFEPVIIKLNSISDEILMAEGNLYGDTLIVEGESALQFKEAQKQFSLFRKPRIIGQTIVAESESLAEIEFKLGITGSGGYGNYYLKVFEILSQDNGHYILGNYLTSHPFSIADLPFFANGEALYKFPVSANLVPGRMYFVGIDNGAVRLNILNHIDIYGSDNIIGNPAFSLKHTGEVSVIGGIYAKPYYGQFSESGQERLLTGQTLQSIGAGRGLLNYKFKHNYFDLLDANIMGSNTGGSFNYNPSEGIIEGKAEDRSALFYRINSIFPLGSVTINAEQQNREWAYETLIEYSLDDGDTWHRVPRLKNAGEENSFLSIFDGERSKFILIRIGYDKSDPFAVESVFTIKDLNISAELLLE